MASSRPLGPAEVVGSFAAGRLRISAQGSRRFAPCLQLALSERSESKGLENASTSHATPNLKELFGFPARAAVALAGTRRCLNSIGSRSQVLLREACFQ